MLTRFLSRIDEAVSNDARFAAAMRGLPAVAGTAGWPAAEQAARSASNAAVRRAFWRAARFAQDPAFHSSRRASIALCAAVGLAFALGVASDALSAPRSGDPLVVLLGP